MSSLLMTINQQRAVCLGVSTLWLVSHNVVICLCSIDRVYRLECSTVLQFRGGIGFETQEFRSWHNNYCLTSKTSPTAYRSFHPLGRILLMSIQCITYSGSTPKIQHDLLIHVISDWSTITLPVIEWLANYYFVQPLFDHGHQLLWNQILHSEFHFLCRLCLHF